MYWFEYAHAKGLRMDSHHYIDRATKYDYTTTTLKTACFYSTKKDQVRRKYGAHIENDDPHPLFACH